MRTDRDEAPSRQPIPVASEAEVVRLERVSMAYDGVGPVLSDVDLTLRQGEFLSIVGPSGCGKSTLLRIISGLQPATGGTVRVRGEPVVGIPPGIGLMFQRDALLPWETVRGNIAIGVACGSGSERDVDARIDELLRLTDLTEFGEAYPRALSGGMRQRVALARTLAYQPDIFLMDEPFSALDAQTKVLMAQELLDIWRRFRKSVVFITHDIEEAVSLSDRVLVMCGRPGRVMAQYRIDLPRPRDAREVRRLPVFRQWVDAIWDDIMSATATV